MTFVDPTRQYRYSFSGADASAKVYYDTMEEDIVDLESLHTISVSIHEAKGPARSLGFRGVKGYARGVRTIAGTMIFTVIEDHPLRPLIEQYQKAVDRGWAGGWSVDDDVIGTGSAFNMVELNNRLPTLLPPFNVLMLYVSEHSHLQTPPTTLKHKSNSLKEGFRGSAWLLRGVELSDISLVTSTNDIVTEMVCHFTATDYKPMTENTFIQNKVDVPANSPSEKHEKLINELYKNDNFYVNRFIK